VLSLLSATGVVNQNQLRLSAIAAEKGIQWGDARHLPVSANSIEVLYTSHMLEHLDRTAAEDFLRDATRVLVPGGHIRIAVPDLRRRVDKYLADGDADKFLDSMYLAVPTPRGIFRKLKYLVVGARHHAWMYDEVSLSKLLVAAGFKEVVSLPAGSTNIPDPGPLDLRQREDDSVYVEARWP
jgi:predicted SAM-dependent methyltransferase